MDMYKLCIEGGHRLQGQVSVAGGKNTAVAVVPAVLLSDEVCTVENVPDIEDVHVLYDILTDLGADVSYDPVARTMVIDPRPVHKYRVPYKLSQRMRASYYFLGALLGRCGQAEVGYPGGCTIGSRPVDQHIMAFRALGAATEEQKNIISAKGHMRGAFINFTRKTVGGTINAMLAATKADGKTILYNAAKEPHVVDLANFLNSMGAKVRGAGTDTITIRGTSHLHGSTYTLIPDQIETGTLMIAAAATYGDVYITGCIPYHMEALSAKLLEMGVQVFSQDDIIHVISAKRHRAVNFSTQEYPGFPTDLQQPLSALLCRAEGVSRVTENIFESRFKHLTEMQHMGAQVFVQEKTSLVTGVPELNGASVTATDLRAGAALVVAGLMAKGITEIYEPAFIERGYEHLEDKLRSLGAVISRVPLEEE